MIAELSDEEILEYLMTSDFIENYNPDEYKFLLHKFRYYYRILHGNFSRTKGDLEFRIINLEKEISILNNEINKEQSKSADLQNQIDMSKKERQLSFKERLSGKTKNI